MHRRTAPALAGLLTLALAVTGCSSDTAQRVAAAAPTTAAPPAATAPTMTPPATTPPPTTPPATTPPATTPPTTTPPAATPTPVAPTTAAPPAAVAPVATVPPVPPPAPAPTPTKAARVYDVATVQQTLTDLRYYVGRTDGKSGAAMRSAVMAFQKVQGIGADGVIGPKTLEALAAPVEPALEGGPADRVEVDLTKQVMYVVSGGALERVLPVSSGNGARYSQKSGGTARALTPVGTFEIERRIVGERKADLGILYDPQYFHRGWAIHGSDSVPAGPASHGCVRVTRTDAKWLLDVIDVGTTVTLYGGKHTFRAGSRAAGTDEPTGDS